MCWGTGEGASWPHWKSPTSLYLSDSTEIWLCQALSVSMVIYLKRYFTVVRQDFFEKSLKGGEIEIAVCEVGHIYVSVYACRCLHYDSAK